MCTIWKSIWNLKVPSKIRHFCWKALNNTLPTKFNLKNREVDNNMLCPICSNHVETTDHILFTLKGQKKYEILPLKMLLLMLILMRVLHGLISTPNV